LTTLLFVPSLEVVPRTFALNKPVLKACTKMRRQGIVAEMTEKHISAWVVISLYTKLKVNAGLVRVLERLLSRMTAITIRGRREANPRMTHNLALRCICRLWIRIQGKRKMPNSSSIPRTSTVIHRYHYVTVNECAQ